MILIERTNERGRARRAGLVEPQEARDASDRQATPGYLPTTRTTGKEGGRTVVGVNPGPEKERKDEERRKKGTGDMKEDRRKREPAQMKSCPV